MLISCQSTNSHPYNIVAILISGYMVKNNVLFDFFCPVLAIMKSSWGEIVWYIPCLVIWSEKKIIILSPYWGGLKATVLIETVTLTLHLKKKCPFFPSCLRSSLFVFPSRSPSQICWMLPSASWRHCSSDRSTWACRCRASAWRRPDTCRSWARDLWTWTSMRRRSQRPQSPQVNTNTLT